MRHYSETKHMIDKFRNAKFTEMQTEVVLEAIESTQKGGLENLATKQDLAEVKSELKQDIHVLELKITQDIHKIDLKVSDIRNEFTKLDGSFYLLKWMLGFIGTASLTTLGILIRMMLKQ